MKWIKGKKERPEIGRRVAVKHIASGMSMEDTYVGRDRWEKGHGWALDETEWSYLTEGTLIGTFDHVPDTNVGEIDRQLNAEEGSGKMLRWVKASERLPNKKCPARRLSQGDFTWIEVRGDYVQIDVDTCHLDNAQVFLHEWEWLEETEAPAAQPKEPAVPDERYDWISWRAANGFSMLPNASWVKNGDPLTQKNTESLYALFESEKAKSLPKEAVPVQQGDVPKMSDELAGRADFAAIEYGKTNGQNVCREEVDYENSADLTDAFLAGQSWMYGMTQDEIVRLKAHLTEARHDADVFKEWKNKAEGNVSTLTERLALATTALEQITMACQNMMENPNVRHIFELAQKPLKSK